MSSRGYEEVDCARLTLSEFGENCDLVHPSKAPIGVFVHCYEVNLTEETDPDRTRQASLHGISSKFCAVCEKPSTVPVQNLLHSTAMQSEPHAHWSAIRESLQNIAKILHCKKCTIQSTMEIYKPDC